MNFNCELLNVLLCFQERACPVQKETEKEEVIENIKRQLIINISA